MTVTPVWRVLQRSGLLPSLGAHPAGAFPQGLELEISHGSTEWTTVQAPGLQPLFLKHYLGAGAGARAAHEGRLCRWLATGGPALPPLSTLPRGWLAFERLPAEAALTALWEARRPTSATAFLRAVGTALATVHGLQLPPRLLRAAPKAACAAPLVLCFDLPPVELLRILCPGTTRVLRIIGQTSIAASLRRLREDWRAATLIHRDLKADHCLRRGEHPSDGVVFLDWEHGGPGDPAWDVGCVLADVVIYWLRDLGRRFGPAASARPGEHRDRLVARWPAVAAFWTEYVRLRPELGEVCAPRRVAAYAGARLVQSAYEHSGDAMALPPVAGTLLRLGEAVLQRPLESLATLWGLEQRGIEA